MHVMIYFWLSALQIPSRITWNTRIVYFLWFSSDAKIGRHLGGKALVELGRRNTKGCFPSVKVTSVLVTFGLQDAGQQIQTFSSVQHALNAFPQGQEEVVTIELSIHYAAIKPVKEWKIVKVNGWIESLFENWRLGLNSSHIIWWSPIINSQAANQKLYGKDFLN